MYRTSQINKTPDMIEWKYTEIVTKLINVSIRLSRMWVSTRISGEDSLIHEVWVGKFFRYGFTRVYQYYNVSKNIHRDSNQFKRMWLSYIGVPDYIKRLDGISNKLTLGPNQYNRNLGGIPIVGHLIEIVRHGIITNFVLETENEDYRVHPRRELKQMRRDC